MEKTNNFQSTRLIISKVQVHDLLQANEYKAQLSAIKMKGESEKR